MLNALNGSVLVLLSFQQISRTRAPGSHFQVIHKNTHKLRPHSNNYKRDSNMQKKILTVEGVVSERTSIHRNHESSFIRGRHFFGIINYQIKLYLFSRSCEAKIYQLKVNKGHDNIITLSCYPKVGSSTYEVVFICITTFCLFAFT